VEEGVERRFVVKFLVFLMSLFMMPNNLRLQDIFAKKSSRDLARIGGGMGILEG